jgi:hypothetical protein
VLVKPLTAAPDLDGWAIVERLLADLAPLAEPVWLVIDDVHELDPDARRQLELLIMRVDLAADASTEPRSRRLAPRVRPASRRPPGPSVPVFCVSGASHPPAPENPGR